LTDGRRESAAKKPEVIQTTMPHQGVSTRMYRENSLMLHRTGDILGILHFAPNIWIRTMIRGAAFRMTKGAGMV